MKKILTTTLIILSNYLLCNAQYKKLLNDSNQWYSFSSFEGSMGTKDYIYGDTTINDLEYKKIYSLSCNYLTKIFLREDTIAKKVYIYDYNQKQESIFYDFSLQVGQYFGSIFLLDSISKNLKSGFLRGDTTYFIPTNSRIFYFSVPNSSDQIVWIEGIGSLSGLTRPRDNWPNGSTASILICHYGNGNKDLFFPYMGTSCDRDCIAAVMPKAKTTTKLNLYPNPAIDNIRLDLNAEIDSNSKIYDCNGILLVEITNQTKNPEINLTNLKEGIYLITTIQSGILFSNTFQILR